MLAHADEVIRVEGNEANLAEPSVLETEVITVPADETVDPLSITASLVEDVVEESIVPTADAEDIIDETSTRDFQ